MEKIPFNFMCEKTELVLKRLKWLSTKLTSWARNQPWIRNDWVFLSGKPMHTSSESYNLKLVHYLNFPSFLWH